MLNRGKKLFAGAAALAIVAGCGLMKKKDDGEDKRTSIKNESGRGCLQGVVRNGISGERIALNQGKEKNKGVFVLVRNKMIAATPIVPDAKDKKRQDLLGEYYLCGFPLDETFPLFVWQDGFQNFEGRIKISSTIAQKTPNSQQVDITRSYPTMMADVDLYPVGVETKDLKFTVYYQGDRLKGAKVQLQPTSRNVFAEMRGENAAAAAPVPNYSNNSDMFYRLQPQIRLTPITKETDREGQAEFSASDLVLGGIYSYLVLPAEGSAAEATGEISIGLRGHGTNLSNEPYEVSVRLEKGIGTPKVVSSSLDKSDRDPEGRIVLHFNQDIELAPGSSSSARASLENEVNAKLLSDRSALNIKIDGKTLTLTPNWQNSPVESDESTLTLVYSNISVRPKGEESGESTLYIPSKYLTIRLFQ